MDALSIAATHYEAIRGRLRAEDPEIDDQCLADTLEGISELPEMLTAIIRAVKQENCERCNRDSVFCVC